MKIAILTELFSPSIGGQEIRYAELAQALTARGHSVHIYCIRNVKAAKAEEAIEGVLIHRHPEAYDYQQPLFRTLRRRPSVVLRYALWCRSVDPKSFDLFIYNQWPIAHILLAPRAMRAKAIIDWCEYRDGTTFGLLQKYLPRLGCANIANSQILAGKLAIRSGLAFSVLPSGIFRGRYRCATASERKGILYLGRIEEHKNLPLMLSSYESLLSKGYEGRLSIAGNGPGLGKVRQLVERSNVADSVDVMGLVTEEQKTDLLATSEIFLLTSRREGFPRVVAEAMASGLPVVTVGYAGNGAADVVRQYGIGRVAGPDPESVADNTLAVIAEWERYSKAGTSASLALDWEVLIDKLLQIAGRD